MWRGIFLVALLILALVAVHAQEHMGGMGHSETNVMIEVNAGTPHVDVNVTVEVNAGEANGVMERVRERVRERVVELPHFVREKVRERVMERMRRTFEIGEETAEKNLLRRAPEVEKRIHRFGIIAKRLHESLRNTFLRYHRAYREWLQMRKAYLAGEVNEEVYLQRTKVFITRAITVMVERLEAFREHNVTEENVDVLIDKLLELNMRVSEVNDLNTLRTLYREEVRPALQEAKDLIREFYGSVSLMTLTGVVVKTEIGIRRILVALQRMDIDVNTDQKVQTMLARIDQLKSRIEDLKSRYVSGEITAREFLRELERLREDVQRTLMEFRSMIRETVKARIAVRARAEARGGRR